MFRAVACKSANRALNNIVCQTSAIRSGPISCAFSDCIQYLQTWSVCTRRPLWRSDLPTFSRPMHLGVSGDSTKHTATAGETRLQRFFYTHRVPQILCRFSPTWRFDRAQVAESSRSVLYSMKSFKNEYFDNRHRLLYGLIGANFLVWVLWKTVGYTPQGKAFMWENFMVSQRSIKEHRYWTLITSCVSTYNGFSLIVNGTILYFFGSYISAAIGNSRLLGLYFFGGILASLFHLGKYWIPPGHALTKSQVWYSEYASINTSTPATLSIAGFFAASWPYTKVNLYGILPVPAWVLVAGIAALSVVNHDESDNTAGDSLVGIASGVAYGIIARKLKML